MERVLAMSSGPRQGLAAAWRHRWVGPVLKTTIAYLILVEIAVQVVFGQVHLGPLEVGFREQAVPRAIFLNGATIGLLYGLLGLGLILIYRANHVINFAQAQLGSVPAVAALLFMLRRDVNYFLVLPVMLAGAALLGGIVEVTVIRRFRHAPRLILTVATIGLSLLLLFFEFQVQTWITGAAVTSSAFTTPWTAHGFQVGPLWFSGDFVVAAVVSVGLCGALAAFFRFTDVGIAVRASAENQERAALLGIPVARVATTVWVIAALLSAIAVFMRAPMTGLTLGSSVGPSVLLYGLAAAAIARMDSMPTCMLAGMGVGILDQSALYGTRRASLSFATMLVVILVALLLQKKRLSRALDGTTSSWQTVKEYRPIPAALRHLPEVRMAKGALTSVVLVAGVVLPLFLPQRYAGRFTIVVIFAIVGVSMVILTGWSGQVSLGQFALAGIGAGVAGGLAVRGADFFVVLALSGLAGALAAIVVGLPALRIQGQFLAITTLAFAFTVQHFVLNRDYLGWWLPGVGEIVGRPKLYGFFSTQSDTRFYFVCVAFLVLFLSMGRALRRYRMGRVFIGARDNGRAIQAYGVSLARTRLAAFAISGFVAAVAGGLYGYFLQSVDASAFTPERSISVFAIAVIGGLTALPGAVLGALYVEGIPFLFSGAETARLLTSSVGLLVLLLLVPGGLAEIFFRGRDRFLRWVATRHGIHVPSLIADALAEEEGQGLIRRSQLGVQPDEGSATCPHCNTPLPPGVASLDNREGDANARAREIVP